jgi:sarcosine oxidase subunit beta
VPGVRRDGGAVTGVATTAGALNAEVVGNAAGAWAPVVDRMVGVEHPLRRTRSPIVRSETGDRDDWDFPFTLLANEYYLRWCPSGIYVGRYDTTYRLNGDVEPHQVDAERGVPRVRPVVPAGCGSHRLVVPGGQ